MESVRVVEPFDAIEHICLCRILRAVDFSSDALRFQRREEALDGCIVPDVPDRLMLHVFAVGHQALELVADILAAAKTLLKRRALPVWTYIFSSKKIQNDFDVVKDVPRAVASRSIA